MVNNNYNKGINVGIFSEFMLLKHIMLQGSIEVLKWNVTLF
jgi:hypothetical protein